MLYKSSVPSTIKTSAQDYQRDPWPETPPSLRPVTSGRDNNSAAGDGTKVSSRCAHADGKACGASQFTYSMSGARYRCHWFQTKRHQSICRPQGQERPGKLRGPSLRLRGSRSLTATYLSDTTNPQLGRDGLKHQKCFLFRSSEKHDLCVELYRNDPLCGPWHGTSIPTAKSALIPDRSGFGNKEGERSNPEARALILQNGPKLIHQRSPSLRLRSPHPHHPSDQP